MSPETPAARHVLRLLTLGAFASLASTACASNVHQDLGQAPPPGQKIVLFSGQPGQVAANWVKRGTTQDAGWTVDHEAMVSHGGDIVTKQAFDDFYLHVEWMEPDMPDAHGQEKGNSGVGLQALYEIQVLDSYGWKVPGKGDCGAVYDQSAPLVNACKPPLQWQTYDIFFRAARWDESGKKAENARVTVLQNGIVVQNNTEIRGTTGIARGPERPEPGPILLQDHGNRVRFRNVWIVPMPLHGSDQYDPHN